MLGIGNDGKGKLLYISHGGGPLPLLGDKSHEKMLDFLTTLPSTFQKPDEILVISAHWEEPVPTVTGSAAPGLLYDYYGFPEESYHLEYPVKGNPELAESIYRHFHQQGIHARIDLKRGIDHGVFIPLMLMYPEAEIPVTQLSLVKGLNPQDHLFLGEALKPLRERNILIIGSGFSVHNMSLFSANMKNAENVLNEAFQNWLIQVCTESENVQFRKSALETWETAPNARYCHPREEHLLPLHVCLGLADKRAQVIFDDYILGMRSLAFSW